VGGSRNIRVADVEKVLCYNRGPFTREAFRVFLFPNAGAVAASRRAAGNQEER